MNIDVKEIEVSENRCCICNRLCKCKDSCLCPGWFSKKEVKLVIVEKKDGSKLCVCECCIKKLKSFENLLE